MVILPPSFLHDCILCKLSGNNPPPHATAVVRERLNWALLLLSSRRELDNRKERGRELEIRSALNQIKRPSQLQL